MGLHNRIGMGKEIKARTISDLAINGLKTSQKRFVWKTTGYPISVKKSKERIHF